MGLFSKPNIPGIDTNALNAINDQNATKQRNIVGGLRQNLVPLSTDFESKRRLLGNDIQSGGENVINQYGQGLSDVNAADASARTTANAAVREQSFRDVPELQRSIRESLGGSGTTGNAAALSALSRPILDANRASRDFSNQNEINRLEGVTGRSEKLADTGLNVRNNALQSKLGLDEGTINELYASGRGDLVEEANKLLGIEEQSGANKLGIEQARQQNDIAQATAAAARRGSIMTSLGSLAGTGIGAAFGGPLGASLGSQLGSMAGNFAGGGSGGGTFDPTLLYAMSQRQPTNRTAVVRSLSANGSGQRVPVGTGSY